MNLFMKRILPLLLAVLMLLTAVGCQPTDPNDGDETDPDTGETTDTTGEEETTGDLGAFLELVKDGNSEFVIVYPEDYEEKEWEAVQRLVTAFQTYTGTKLKVRDDFTSHSIPEKTYEILVGPTARAASQEVSSKLLFGQYTICIMGTKLVICGSDANTTYNGVSYFERQILRKKMQAEGADPDTFLFYESDEFTNETSYTIKSAVIGGRPIKDYRLVIPANASVEYYIARLIQAHVSRYVGANLQIVRDNEPAQDCEILIGNTSRTTVTAPTGEYRIEVTGTKVQVVASSILGLPEAYWGVVESLIPISSATLEAPSGTVYTGEDNSPTDLQKTGDMRILYHNIVGYTLDKCPVEDRSDMMLAVYSTYNPEILCWQEASAKQRDDARSLQLKNWLKENYVEICYKEKGGLGNPIFYRKDAGLTLLDSGYSRARSGDKGSTWAVFQRADGTIFGVTNSHFAADTNANNNHELGNQYRTQDAENLVNAIAGIRETYGGITIISGGDYNSTPGSTAYYRLTGSGMTPVRNIAAYHTPFSAHHAYPEVAKASGLYTMLYNLTSPVANAIDHIMHSGEDVTIHSYKILSDPFSLTSSDHAPHYVDISFN